MSTTVDVTFDDPNEFTFDDTVIEVSNGTGKLKLADETGILFTQTYTDSTGFTFDSTKVQFNSGILEQIDQTPANSILGATYNSTIDASWVKTGSATANLNGSPTLVSNKLQCFGTQGVYYEQPITAQGAIKFKYTPNYTGNPSTNLNLVATQLDASTVDRVVLFHSPTGSGQLRFTVNDSTGANIVTAGTFGTYVATLGVEVEIELNWDSTTGDCRCYLDGNQVGVTLTLGAWSRNVGVTGRNWVAANQTVYNTADGSFDDVLYFDTVQHTGSSYTPGYTVNDGIYVEAKTDLPQFVYGGVGAIQGFTEAAETGGVNTRYIGNGLYYNGSIWATSDGSYAQANDISTVNSNINSFPVQDTLDLSVVFPDTNTKSEIDQTDVTYTGQKYFTGSKLRPVLNIPVTSVTEATSVEILPANTAVTFTVVINSVEFWYNGATWTESNGTIAETNLAADVDGNLSTLPLDAEGSFLSWFAYFSTSDGLNTPELDRVTITFLFEAQPLETPATTTIFGSLRDISGGAQSASIRIESESHFFISNNSIQPTFNSGPANSDALAEVTVIITEPIDFKYHFYVDYFDTSGNEKTVDLGYSIAPEAVATNISDLTFTSEP